MVRFFRAIIKLDYYGSGFCIMLVNRYAPTLTYYPWVFRESIMRPII